MTEHTLDGDEDWNRFLELTGKVEYMARIKEWGKLTGKTHDELRLSTADFFTTSIIVVE